MTPVAQNPTQELETTPIWTLSQARYQFLRGIKQPHIMEISFVQMARMSKREKARYQAQRAGEWDASGDCKVEYDRLVWEAYQRGEFTLQSEGISADAKTAVYRGATEAKKQDIAEKMKAAQVENRILTVNDAEIGDRVYTLYGSRYVEIVGKLQKSFKVKDASGAVFSLKAGACQWLHYKELVKAVEEGRPVNPHRVIEDTEPPEPPAPAATAAQPPTGEPEAGEEEKRCPCGERAGEGCNCGSCHHCGAWLPLVRFEGQFGAFEYCEANGCLSLARGLEPGMMPHPSAAEAGKQATLF
jgi:hypothetical protein